MKSKISACLFCIFLGHLFYGCTSAPKNTITRTEVVQSSSFYEGDGGKGISLAVLPPDYKGFNSNDSWIPLYIQGVLTNNFNIYSEISVLDRQNIEKIISEQEFAASGYFSDDDYIRIGNLTNAQLILIGTLDQISIAEISLQLSVSDTETGERKASFAKICTIDDIKNAAILNEATLQLLSMLGVNMTEKGRSSLFSSKISTNNAETFLAKGITAQRNGTIIEALSYYYEAASYNPALSEATSRLSVLSARVQNGNIGESVRNDIQQRNAWVSILQECETFYAEHLPYEVVYNSNLRQGNVDYTAETVNLDFSLAVMPSVGFDVVQNILDGLKKTGKKEQWGLGLWPLSSDVFADIPARNDFRYMSSQNVKYTGLKRIKISAALMNSSGDTISTATSIFSTTLTFLTNDFGDHHQGSENAPYDIDRLRVYPTTANIVFKSVNANDITDNLIIRITSVNDIDTNDGYANISITTRDIKSYVGSKHRLYFSVTEN
jgi:hypothetical protein